jgi:hypothetical protein
VHHSDESPNTGAEDNASEPRPTKVRSYDREFAERVEKVERSEPVINTPAPMEHHAPATESAPKIEAPKAEIKEAKAEVKQQDSGSES